MLCFCLYRSEKTILLGSLFVCKDIALTNKKWAVCTAHSYHFNDFCIIWMILLFNNHLIDKIFALEVVVYHT
jgi:hypothetical protein